jgi:hypothetical protein
LPPDEKKRAVLFYRARKWFLQNPDTTYSKYTYYTGDHEMDAAIFATVEKETPEQRKAFLKGALFKAGGALAAIPEPTLGPRHEPPRTIPSGPRSPAPPPAPTRIVRGIIPPKYPPPKQFPRLVRRERIMMQDSPEIETPFAPALEPTSAPSAAPEIKIEADTVPETTTLTESKFTMPPKKSHRIMNSPKATEPKAQKVKPTQKIFAVLEPIHTRGGELPTYLEYCKAHGKVEPYQFYQARNKLLKDKKKTPTGRGRPAEVFTPAARNGHAVPGRTQFEILYTTDESPGPAIMAEVQKVLGAVLASAIPGASMEEFEFKMFHPKGYEIRRAIQ